MPTVFAQSETTQQPTVQTVQIQPMVQPQVVQQVVKESEFNIHIGMWSALGIIAAVIGGVWWLGKKFGRVETKIENFETRLTGMEGRLDNAFGSASPISLKPIGTKALEQSGLKDWIDKNRETLITDCETKNKMENQYDIQECAFKFFDSVDLGSVNESVKKTAFVYGWSVETVRRIGGIYFRDFLLEKKGYKPEDLDKPKE